MQKMRQEDPETVAEETAEKRAADPKRQEAYGNVIEQIRERSGETVCAVDLVAILLGLSDEAIEEAVCKFFPEIEK